MRRLRLLAWRKDDRDRCLDRRFTACSRCSSPWSRPAQVHLHGRDVDDPRTPYFAGFKLRYFASIPRCLSSRHSLEWLEVVHPTPAAPLHTLRIVPIKPELLVNTRWRG